MRKIKPPFSITGLCGALILSACNPVPTKCCCKFPGTARGAGTGKDTMGSARPKPTAAEKPTGPPGLRVKFAIDENFLVVHTASYYYKAISQKPLRSGRGQRRRNTGRWTNRRSRLAVFGPRIWVSPPRRPFVSDTQPMTAWLDAARRISLQRFLTLRGSRAIRLPGRWNFWTPRDTTDAKLEAYQKGMAAYVKQLQRLPEYTTLLAHTRKRLQFCRKQWQRNFLKSFRIMQRLTGLDFRRCYTVYITYPAIPNGRYLGKKGPPDCPWAFMWGAFEDFPNYTTVYLWHELLHGYFNKTELEHALIQLLTDNELRVRLNGGTYPPFYGHRRLIPHMLALLPAWQAYLRRPDRKDIGAFLRRFLRTGGRVSAPAARLFRRHDAR